MTGSGPLSITSPAKAAPEVQRQKTPPSGKLAGAAREFESMLLQGWLEKMNASFTGTSPSEDAAHDTVSSLGTQAIASALAARGGIGLATLLLRQLQPPAPIGSQTNSFSVSLASPHHAPYRPEDLAASKEH